MSQNRSTSDRVGVVEALEREATLSRGGNRRLDERDTGRRRSMTTRKTTGTYLTGLDQGVAERVFEEAAGASG